MYNKRKISIIVLAGGFGKRISKSIGNKPKILAPIGNTPFLFYFLKWINPFLEMTNCQLILSVFYKSDLIINYLNEQDLKLKLSMDDKPYGTFGAVCNAALKYPSEDYLILNGDTIFACDFFQIYQQFLLTLNRPLLILKEKNNSDRYCGYLNSNQNWTYSKRDCHAISMGAYFISHQELKRRWNKSTKLEFNLADFHKIQNILMNDEDCLAIDPVKGYLIREKAFFIDIGIEESFSNAQLSIPSFLR